MNSPLKPFLRKTRWLLILFVVFTLFFTIFGDRGLIKIYKLYGEIKRLTQSIKTLEVHNKDLTENIKKMKNELTFQERSARETLGMVKENEIIYEFSD